MALTLYRITATNKLVVVDSASPPSGSTIVTDAATTNLVDTAPWVRALDTNTPSIWHPAKYFAGAPEILVPVPMTLNVAPICQPYIYTDGTAIDHIIHTDGSCDISFEWSWGTNVSFDSSAGVSLVNNTITSTTPALPTGTAVKYIANTSSALGGLTSKTIYYIIQISVVSTTVVYKLASTYANAIAGTAVTITAIGSGVHTLNSGVEADIDGFIIITYNSASNTAYTLGTAPPLESSFSVPANRRAFFMYGAPADKYYTFGVYAFRKVDAALASSGLVISAISASTVVGENPYQPSTTVAFAGNITGTIDNVPVASVSATVAGTAIYRNAGAPTNDPIPTAIATTVNADGSKDVLLSWTYTQGTIPADGLGIVYVTGTGTVAATDSHQLVSTASTSHLFRGLPQDATYRAGIAAYRTNDTGLHVGPVIQPIATPDWRVIGGTANFTGTVGGSSSINIDATVTGTANFRNASAPTNSPVISSITTSASTVGTVDITLNWTYTQGTLTADEFMLYCVEGAAVPTTSSPVLAIINGSSRSATFFGVSTEKSYKVGITARRKTATGVFETPIVASWVRTGGTANITATIDGTPATNVTATVGGTAVYISNSVPTNSPVPTAISIVNNADGSRDIILTWTYTQGAIPADGLGIAYVVGTGIVSAADPHILVSVNTTSYRFQGVPQDVSYRAGIAAYRTNDSGAHIGTIVQPISAPDWRVTGTTANITGNIAGTAAATVLTNITSAAGTATWTGITGAGKAADNATVGATFGTNITGQITAANVSTYMNIGSLSAITASLGTITAGSLTASAGIDITGVSRFKGANLDSTSSYYPALEISQGTSGGTGLFSNVTLGSGNAIVGKAMVAGGSGSGLHGAAAGYGYGAMIEHAVNGSGAALWVNGLMQVTNSTMVNNLNAHYLSGYAIESFVRGCGTHSGIALSGGGGLNLFFDGSMSGGYRTYSSGNNTVYIGTVSDETIKKDVVPEVLGLDFINRIEPVTFRMKADDNLIHHGFIAQRMTEFFDDVNLDVLYTEANDGIKGISYIALIAPLVKAIQELTIKLNNIEKELQK